ncbi:MAG: hypothetical protein GTO53_02100 [Planctomycetales bacterium]|nr:hypothetical protein [Planctomycetales bacterium]NIM07961.1 hypothetical protein [Planctomycetales bacterium]NIN07439.1 hypothetical protein [Planctomycetales bacterium]NIN76543.1 hypothetical protein [Planctomycetales bacterium]NIO33730.1 hypothetical protein [Planctomycetales bacterium]
MAHSIARQPARRRGAIAVLAALLIVTFLAIVAFGVDVGYLALTRSQLQNAADAAALAGTAGLIDGSAHAMAQAKVFGEHNEAAARDLTVLPDEDVVIGSWDFQSRIFQRATAETLAEANAVQATTRLVSGRNNSAPLFFGRIFGLQSVDLDAVAIAALWNNLRGFRIPPNGENLKLLPMAFDLESWDQAIAGVGPDNWSWNEAGEQTVNQSDGIPEINLHPVGNNGAPGNRGLIEIGAEAGETDTFRQQIVEGINATELNYHGGELDLGPRGKMNLSGEPGVRSTLRRELESIVGQTRIVPLFTKLSDNGTNATYTIVKFGAVRIMDVSFRGNPKKIIAQPTQVYVHGAIPDLRGEVGSSSDLIYSAPRLVQ